MQNIHVFVPKAGGGALYAFIFHLLGSFSFFSDLRQGSSITSSYASLRGLGTLLAHERGSIQSTFDHSASIHCRRLRSISPMRYSIVFFFHSSTAHTSRRDEFDENQSKAGLWRETKFRQWMSDQRGPKSDTS